MINKKLKKIRDILLNICDDVFHYEAGEEKRDRYIVWAEDGEPSSLDLDNLKNEQTITGTIDFFTTTEYDETVDKIQDELNNNGISYLLNSVQFETETKIIHYEWRFEI